MNTVVYNYQDSTIPLKWESEALRASYLLSDNTECTGSSSYYLFEEELLDKHDERQRLAFLKLQLENADPDKTFTEWWDMLTCYLKSRRMAGDYSKKAATFRYAAKRDFEAYYKDLRTWYRGIRKTEGFVPLGDLVKERGLYYAVVMPGSPELEWHEVFRTASHQWRLGVEPGDESGGTVHLLTYGYFDTAVSTVFREREIPLLQIPLLNGIEVPMLRQMRAELQGAAVPFRQAIDCWVASGSEPVNEPAADAAAKDVVTAAKALQKALNEHPVLRHYPAGQELIALRMRVADLWEQALQSKTIVEETYKRLHSYTALVERRVPVLALRRLAPEAKDSQSPPLSRLKRIAVD